MSDGPDISALTPEQAGAKLAEMTAAYRGPAAQDPQSKLNRFYADSVRREKLEAGDGKTHAEFAELAKAAAEMSPVDAAMSGARPEVPSSELRQMEEMASYLRSLGLRDDVVREAIDTNSSVNQETHDAAQDWKRKNLTDETFVRAYLNGSVEHVKLVTLCNIVLMQPVESK